MDERRERMGGRRDEDQWSLWDKRLRDALIFIVGIIGTIHELFVIVDPRPYALVFLASLIGIPFVMSRDEQRRDKDRQASNDESR
jgi:hypothetical protein